jgi:autotransporter-associated beta strand protein
MNNVQFERAACGTGPLADAAFAPRARIALLRQFFVLTACAGALLVGCGCLPAFAVDGTWTVAPPLPGFAVDWTTGTNWSSTPVVPDNIATFTNNGAAPQVFISNSASINEILFTAGAPSFALVTIGNVNFAINGAGIVNNSSTAQRLFVEGPGTVNFNNASSAGNLFIAAEAGGNLNFNNTSTAANSSITVNLGSTANFNNASTAGTAGILNQWQTNFNDTSSAGNATILNLSSVQSLNFNNASTAGNATILNNNINALGFQFNNSSTAGNASITNNGFITFNDGSTAGHATIINNAGTAALPFNFSSQSGLTFNNTSSAGSANITNNNVLVFGGSSTAGSATITNNYATFFSGNSTAGNARLINNAGATINFGLSSGPNNDSKLSAGSIEGAGNFNLGATELTVGSNNLSTTVSGAISGNNFFSYSGLVKVGTGTLTFSGTESYRGVTTVDGGALVVDGSNVFSLTTVNAGGTLGGSGIVGNTAIAGGTLAPGSAAGSAFGPLTVQGNLSFTAASTYMVQVTPANAGRTNVTATATLGGATVNALFLPGSYVNRQYTIVNATGGLGGTVFNPVVTSNVANIQSTLTYDANDAFLNIKLIFAPTAGPNSSGLNVNQQNVANALTNFFNSTGSIPAVFTTLTPAGLTQASGEVATGSQQTTFAAMAQFLGLLLDPFIGGRGEPAGSAPSAIPFAEQGDAATARKPSGYDAYAAVTKAVPHNPLFDPRWSVWAAGFGASQTTDGSTTLGSNTTTSSFGGIAAGADYLLSPRTIAGFALAGGATSFSVANSGSGRSDLFQAGAFVKHTVGSAYISGALAYGWQEITTDRTVTIAGVDRLHANFNANAFSGRVEGGYRFVMPWMGGVGITPYAAGQFTTFDLPAYAEQVLSGANTFARASGSKSVTDTRSELGVRTDKSFAAENAILTLRGRVAWAHDFNPDRTIAATFQALPGASFVVNGAAQAPDSALTTASAEMKWLNAWSAAATFEGEFSEVTRSYAGKGVVRYAW